MRQSTRKTGRKVTVQARPFLWPFILFSSGERTDIPINFALPDVG